MFVMQVGPVNAKKASCRSRACEARAAAKVCAQRRVVPCIRHAALRYRLPAGWLLRVARCESRLNPYAHNRSGASGLFQFLPSTWRTTPYGRYSIWSARHQALAAAWMFAHHRSSEWVCR